MESHISNCDEAQDEMMNIKPNYTIIQCGYLDRIDINYLKSQLVNCELVYMGISPQPYEIKDEFIEKMKSGKEKKYLMGSAIVKNKKTNKGNNLDELLNDLDFCAFYGSVYEMGYITYNDNIAEFYNHDTESG